MAGLEDLKIKDDVQVGDSSRVVKRELESVIVNLPIPVESLRADRLSLNLIRGGWMLGMSAIR